MMEKLYASHGHKGRKHALISVLFIQEDRFYTVIVLVDEIAPENAPIITQIFSRQYSMWIVATFVLTMAAASLLAYTGFLSTDPISAATDGFLVAIVYVGYRVLNAYRSLRLRAKMNIVIDHSM